MLLLTNPEGELRGRAATSGIAAEILLGDTLFGPKKMQRKARWRCRPLSECAGYLHRQAPKAKTEKALKLDGIKKMQTNKCPKASKLVIELFQLLYLSDSPVFVRKIRLLRQRLGFHIAAGRRVVFRFRARGWAVLKLVNVFFCTNIRPLLRVYIKQNVVWAVVGYIHEVGVIVEVRQHKGSATELMP